MKIGIYSGGFKPLTKGHFDVIRRAAQENDKVFLFVSTGDRVRKEEFPIYWEDMKVIWNKLILKNLPPNVSVEFVSAPIKPMVEMLDQAETKDDIYTIYTDVNDYNDIFTPRRLEKYKKIIDDGKLNFTKYERGIQTANISGTLMRKFLGLGSLEYFSKGLPDFLKPYSKFIFKKLGGKEV
jgi:cytidyltransferase-like protein